MPDLPNRPEMWDLLLHPRDRAYAQQAVAAHLERRTKSYQAEYRLRCKNGSYKWVHARGAAIWDAEGSPTRLLGTHTDITDRKEVEAQLTHHANHDPLTGLANRRLFFASLDAHLLAAQSSGKALSLCLCDLDSFKSVNDREGHAAGDDVLVTFARILKAGLRNYDLVGRIGGDEFCVLLPNTNSAEAAECLERVRERLESVAFTGDANTVFSVTASFGIAEVSPDSKTGELLDAADRALYSAKHLGRNAIYPAVEPISKAP